MYYPTACTGGAQECTSQAARTETSCLPWQLKAKDSHKQLSNSLDQKQRNFLGDRKRDPDLRQTSHNYAVNKRCFYKDGYVHFQSYILNSQNKRLVEIGWHLQRLTLLLKKGHLELVAQDHVRYLLNISKDGDTTTSLCQCSVTPTVNMYFLMYFQPLVGEGLSLDMSLSSN